MRPSKGLDIFSSIFKFIDDPCTFSNDLYPDELILEKENEDLFRASFLDLLIELHDRKYTTE